MQSRIDHDAEHRAAVQARLDENARRAKPDEKKPAVQAAPVFDDELQRPPSDEKKVYGTDAERWDGVMGMFAELLAIVHKLADHPSLGISRTQAATMTRHFEALGPKKAEAKKVEEKPKA